jgi:hypothetical protein
MEYTDERILEALLRLQDRYRAEHTMHGDVGVDEARKADNIVVGTLKGQRVRLVFLDREHSRREPGDEGTVATVGSRGDVMVCWDRGYAGYADRKLTPGRDRWEWLGAPPRMDDPDELILETLLRIKNGDQSNREFDDMVRKTSKVGASVWSSPTTRTPALSLATRAGWTTSTKTGPSGSAGTGASAPPDCSRAPTGGSGSDVPVVRAVAHVDSGAGS